MEVPGYGKNLVVVSGPSGCGKDTVVELLLKDNPDMTLSVSYTTRKKRDYEEEGIHYYFTTREDFEQRTEAGLMLETAEYNGNYYGTPLPELIDRLKHNRIVILVIEVQGGKSVRRIFPEALQVFIMPPSMEELERRLRRRCSETEEELYRRLEIAQYEMSFAGSYDVVIVNDDLNECKAELEKEILLRQESHQSRC